MHSKLILFTLKTPIILLILTLSSHAVRAETNNFLRGLGLDPSTATFKINSYRVNGSQGVSDIWIGQYQSRRHGRRAAIVVSTRCRDQQQGYCLYPIHLSLAQEAMSLGVRDLGVSGSISLSNTSTRMLDVKAMKLPVLLVQARYKEAKPSTETSKELSSGSNKQRPKVRLRTKSRNRFIRQHLKQTETLFFVSLQTGQSLLQLDTSHHTRDGFGGHTLSNFKIEAQDNKLILSTMRSDRLSAPYARCKAPKAYPLRFELQKHRFVKLNHPQFSRPCR